MPEGKSAWHMAGALVGSVLRGVFVGGFLACVPFLATMLLVLVAGVTPVAFAVPVLIAVFVATIFTLVLLPRLDAPLRVDVDRSPEPTRIRLVRPFRRTWWPIGELRAVTVTEHRARLSSANLPEAVCPSEVAGPSQPARSSHPTGEGLPEEDWPNGAEVTLTGPGGHTWTAYVRNEVAADLAAQFTTMLAGTSAVVQAPVHYERLTLGKAPTSSSWFSGGSASANSGAAGC